MDVIVPIVGRVHFLRSTQSPPVYTVVIAITPGGGPILPVEEELELELDLIESIWMDPECIQYWTASGNYPRGDGRWLPPATRARARVAHTRERSD